MCAITTRNREENYFSLLFICKFYVNGERKLRSRQMPIKKLEPIFVLGCSRFKLVFVLFNVLDCWLSSTACLHMKCTVCVCCIWEENSISSWTPMWIRIHSRKIGFSPKRKWNRRKVTYFNFRIRSWRRYYFLMHCFHSLSYFSGWQVSYNLPWCFCLYCTDMRLKIATP